MLYRLRTLLIVLALGPPVVAADRYLTTDSDPRLRIQSVEMPERKSEALTITLELGAKGKAPVALSQEQFSIHICTDEQPYRFVCDATFAANVPRVLLVTPEKASLLSVGTSTNRAKRSERWADLPPGKYTIRVYINSGKEREFDYQWLGQTYSDSYTLVIK
jgi:hypothetical protein